MFRTIKWFEDNFKIEPLDIIDIKGWNPYSLNEGLVYDDTRVELSLVEICKLSKLDMFETERVYHENS